MSLDWSETKQPSRVANASEKSIGLQKDLLKAFNAQTKAIERQSKLQEKANSLQEKTLAALEAIANNTAPKMKHVKNQNKTTQL